VKLHAKYSLLAIPVLTVLLLTSVPSAGARDRRWERPEPKKNYSMPEGSGGAVMALAAGVLGGALLLSRRKRRATAA
jgi:hypothetical protein